ncbi:MAG: class I SAM-dependent RNA methyltransferase [Treponema sp.]|jgi:23S rRNA (uracil1939-C5)-methyltransferase|nr:class I SAM-dependent RNA methyltransferase [Treponema sp.]
MAMGEIFNSKVEGIAAGGAGIVRLGDTPVFVEMTAPGDRVNCRITEEHRGWARAELLEVSEASADRVDPLCAFYGRCGGCRFQHVKYEAQLDAKRAVLCDAFERIGGFSPPSLRLVPSEPWEYRNRMEFHRLGSAGFGLKARKSAEVIPVADCPVADPGIRRVLKKTARGERVLALPPEKDRFTVYARGGVFLGEGGISRGKIRLLDREMHLDAGVFFQSNGTMLEKLIADLRELASGADRRLPMADLFCGVGTFAVFLGELFPHVDLVEENKRALALARENLRGRPAEFFALRDDEWIGARGRGARRGCGFIVADPPRQGLSSGTARRLAAEGPPLLAYVSCDPATLARDAAVLLDGGYRLAELRLYDFYPQTAHIESLSVFKR